MKHWIRLPNDLIRRCTDWASAEIKAGRFNNKYTSHGAEKKPELQAAAKMCEMAFAAWADLDSLKAVKLTWDEGGDVLAWGTMVDVKSCEMEKSLLIWPEKKVDTFDRKKFDAFVLVKHNVPDFLISRWVRKDRFRRERIIATKISKPRLTPGTRYMRETDMEKMDSFPAFTRSEQIGCSYFDEGNRLLHFCRCGEPGRFGHSASLLRNKRGRWYCHEHNPQQSAEAHLRSDTGTPVSAGN